MDCKHYDNWCEEEKRSCNNCYYERGDNMSDEEKKAIEYFKEKIKNKLPLYEETYVDGKLYRINILQLETNFTEEQANKTEILLNLIEKQQKEIEQLKEEE